MYVTLNMGIILMFVILFSKSSDDDDDAIGASWILKAMFLILYGALLPLVCIYHEFWLRRFCANYMDAAYRCGISCLLYITIGIPVPLALPLAMFVGMTVSREYFNGLRAFQRRNLLPLYAWQGLGCMGGVGCRSVAPPVSIQDRTWRARWRGCEVPAFEGQGCCSYWCWRCSAAWTRTNKILTFYAHSQSDFRLAGKPSDLCAVDCGVHSAAVMQLAHIGVLLVLAFLYDVFF